MFRYLLLLSIVSIVPIPAEAEGPSFRRDVMQVLAKGGCNSGACHGNLNGKGGLRLSLRGEDPDTDFKTLTRGTLARRADPHQPDASLLLRKASGELPHEGGVRFRADDVEYRTLRDWIASGAPDDRASAPRLDRLAVTPTERIAVAPEDHMSIHVRGHFSDGSQRDLTRMAVYEVTEPGIVEVSVSGEVRKVSEGEVVILVRYLEQQVPVRVAFVPPRPEFVWSDLPESNPIDRFVFDQLKVRRMYPSALSSDAVFVRRVYLDTIGILPTPAETRAFLEDASPDKRDRLIDTLLDRPEFADFWALKWADLLRNEEKTLDPKGVRVFHRWMRESFATNKPLNEFAAELVAGTGSTYEHPPANFYRALRDPYTRAEAVAQVFLGIRLGCAKCHNHPFDRWKRDEYHQFAALFAQIDYQVRENERQDRLDKHEFNGEQVVYVKRGVQLPAPGNGSALKPGLIGTETPNLRDSGDRLGTVAEWIRDPENPFFARSQVNRIWSHIMGRGLVEPNDDFRATNPPTNPPLMEYLTTEFVQSGFQVKHMVRLILNSRTYQLNWEPNETNAEDELHFSRSVVRPLTAEQLIDAVSQVLEVRINFEGYPKGMRAVSLAAPRFPARGRALGMGEQFLKAFGQPDRLLNCDCERSSDAGLIQAFQLITGEFVHQMIREPDNAIGKALSRDLSDAEIVRHFYVKALSREPEASEEQALVAYIDKAPDRRAAIEDVVWGILNAKEFLLRR